MSNSFAGNILSLNELYTSTDKEIINKNIDKILSCETSRERDLRLMHFTDSGKHTVVAWMNRGRPDVKIPLMKLCMLAQELETDISVFFES